MASTNPVKVLNVCQVTPPLDSPESSTKFSLPLTFFDTMFLKFYPSERVLFYKLSELTTSQFNSVIVPRLKHSLSLTLLHFLPLAGKVTLPPHATKPVILYTPNEGVSLTVAESNDDLDHLSGNTICDAAESRHYVPHLEVSDSVASIIALQITLFPNQGFCISYSGHHAILDGKSTAMFIKAWSYICKHSKNGVYPSLLPPELAPFLDRTVIPDPEGLDMVFLNHWLELKWPGLDCPNPRSLKLFAGVIIPTNFVRATFVFSLEDIMNLRERVVSELDKDTQEDTKQTKPIRLSSFVLSFAYTLICLVKAKGLASDKVVNFGFSADCRGRLDPPIPSNYFGNCIVGRTIFTKAETLMRENGLAFVAKKFSESIKNLEKGVLEGVKDIFEKNLATEPGTVEVFGVAGSNRFDNYGWDFGWGRPTKVELTSIDRIPTCVSIAESKDGDGGVEVGIALKKHEMEIFHSLFVNGLKDPLRPVN